MFSDRSSSFSSGLNPLWEAKVAKEAAGQKLIDLTNSNPTEQGFQYPEGIPGMLGHPSVLEYRPNPKGLLQSREAIVAYYQSRGRTCTTDDLLLTASTSEAYSFLFKLLCNPGDEILIPSPTYPLFDSLAELESITLLRYPLRLESSLEQPQGKTSAWKTDFDFLRSIISTRTKALILVNPNNPTGHICTAEEIKAYLDLAEEYDLALIVDEVFSDYLFTEKPFLPVLSKQPLVFTLNGFSKLLGLPQLKLGWIHVSGKPTSVKEAIGLLENIADTYLSVNTPVQLATGELLNLSHSLQSMILDRLKLNRTTLARLTTASDHVRCQLPEAGWSAVLSIKVNWEDEAFALELLNSKNVLVHSGHLFGFETGCHLIVSLLGDAREFEQGIEHILAYGLK